MFFDRFAGIVEKFFPALVPHIQKTKLFIFPGRAHEILPQKVDLETMKRVGEELFLPFQHIAVEDTLSLVLLWDDQKEQRGLHCPRHFIEYSEIGTPVEEADARSDARVRATFPEALHWPDPEEFERLQKKLNARVSLLLHGKFNDTTITGEVNKDGEPLVHHDFEIIESVIYDPDKGIIRTEDAMDAEGVRGTNFATVSNAWVAMKEVWYFNSPDKFILEERPIDSRKHVTKAAKRGKIVRRQQRPQYTILHPQTIRQRLRLPSLEKGGPKRPHERRAHRRTFRDSKFWRMQGKTIIIPATWVGPSEAVIGKKIYRVLLDK